MIDPADQSADAPSLVPIHLREPQSIGPIPVRTFYVLLGRGLLVGAPLATAGRNALGDVGLWLGLVPLLLGIPFALRWLAPPAEHGALQLGEHLVRLLCRRSVLGQPQQPDLAGLRIDDSVVHV